MHYKYLNSKQASYCVCSCSRIIWLGDLNYRIALSYRYAKALVEMRNWRALLENDQACKFLRFSILFLDLYILKLMVEICAAYADWKSEYP